MQANRGRDTKPEVALRKELHRRGLRYRKNRRIDALDVKVRPDIVFGPSRIAVFVDGCFWHRCPLHATEPKTNAGYWVPKLLRNVERDRRVNSALETAGWTVIRVWEHESAADAAVRVTEAVARAKRTR